MLLSFRACGPIAADIFLRLAWARAQATDEACQLKKRLVDIVLALDEHTVTQRGFKLLADTIDDDFLMLYVAYLSRPGDRLRKLGR